MKTHVTVHFMDGTRIRLQSGSDGKTDPMAVVGEVRKGLDADKLVAEIDDSLFVIPGRNVKYVQVSPCPRPLPEGIGIMKGGHLAE